MEPKQNFISKLMEKAREYNPFKPIVYNRPDWVKANVAMAASSTPPALDQYSFDRNDFKRRISYNETRGQSDPYRTIGVTGDLGRYQVSPNTLSAWSEPWLGKAYDQKSFLADQDAQDRFFDEYMNMAEAYKLNPQEAAITWHRGWGAAGVGDRAKRKQLLRAQVDKYMADPDSFGYLNTFNNAQ